MNDVELHALSCGEAEPAVGETGESVEPQPLFGGDGAAGDRRRARSTRA